MSKKYTPTEAALAVLKKAQELYGQSELAKATTGKHGGKGSMSGYERGVHPPTLATPGQSIMGTHVRSPNTRGTDSKEMARRHAEGNLKDLKALPKPKLDKAEDPLNSIAGDRIKRAAGYKEHGQDLNQKIALDGAKEAHQERLQGIKNSPKPKLDKAEPSMQGHVKLAQFMGRMEAKKGSKINKTEKVGVSDTYAGLTGKGHEYRVDKQGKPIAHFINGKLAGTDTPKGNTEPTLVPKKP